MNPATMSQRAQSIPGGALHDRLMAWGLLGLVVFAPLAFGGAESWARGVIQIVAGLLGAAWLLARARGRPAPSPDLRLAVPMALVVLLVVFQQTPMPPWLVRIFSPSTAGLYAATVPGWSEGRGADPAELPAWTMSRVADRMPPASAAAAQPPAAPIPVEMSRPLGAWRTISIEPFATRDDLILLLCCVMAFVVAARMGRDQPSLERLAQCAALTGAVVSALGIVQMLTWNGRIYWVREGTYKNVFGPFVNRNSYAALAGLVLPVALCLAAAGIQRWRFRTVARPAAAVVFGSCALAIGAGIVMSGSRGGMLTSLAGTIALMMFLAPWRASWSRRLALPALAAATGVAGLAWGGALAARGGMLDGPLAHRLDVWARSLALVAEYPLLGAGLGTFRYAFLPHAPPERSWWTTAHNEYLEMVCDLGLLGAGLALVAFLGWARGVSGRAAQAPVVARALRAGMLAGLAALMLHAVANADLRVPAIALLAAAFAGAARGTVAGDPNAEVAPPRSAPPGAGRATTIALVLAALLLAGISLQGGVARIAAFRARYLAGEALPRAALDEAWDRLAQAAWWQPSDPATWRQMSTVARNATGFGVAFRGFDGFHQQDRLGAGLGATARALALNPAHAAAWMDLASLYEAQGLARVKHERMLAGDAGTDDVGVQGLSPEDRVAVAATMMASDLQPEMFLHHEFLARLYWRRGMLDDAAVAIRRSFALMPRPSAHDALEEKGLAEELSAAILAGIAEARIGPFITEVSRLRGEAEMLERLGRFPEAAAAWNAVKETGRGEDAAECDVRIAQIDQSQGRFEESLVGLRRAAAHADPRWSAEALYFIGRALSHLGDHQQALGSFAQYLERRPDVPAGWQAVGKEMEATGDARGAETTYRAALERFPGDAGIVKLLVALLKRQGRTEEAGRIAARPGSSGTSREVEEILRRLRQGGARSRP